MESNNEYLPRISVRFMHIIVTINTLCAYNPVRTCRGTFGDGKTHFHLEPLNHEDNSVSCALD